MACSTVRGTVSVGQRVVPAHRHAPGTLLVHMSEGSVLVLMVVLAIPLRLRTINLIYNTGGLPVEGRSGLAGYV